jgi:hypothetical protein
LRQALASKGPPRRLAAQVAIEPAVRRQWGPTYRCRARQTEIGQHGLFRGFLYRSNVGAAAEDLGICVN